MTIEVQITNKDKHRTIRVRLEKYRKRDMAMSVEHYCEIKPQETRSLVLHLLQDILLQEEEPNGNNP